MSEFTGRLQQVKKAISREDGRLLASYLSLPVHPGDGFSQSLQALAKACMQSDHRKVVKSTLGSRGELGTVVAEYLAALMCLASQNFRGAFEAEKAAYLALLEHFKENNWVIPVLKTLSEDLRLLAICVDHGTGMADNEYLREAEMLLKGGFTVVAKDRTPVTQPSAKKLAIFIVTNVLFKIYFRLNTLHNATKIVNVVEGPGTVLGDLEYFPVCDVVTYKYYIGRLRMFEDNFEEARECLHLSLKHTPMSRMRNRQRILASLIPVEMSLGVFPTAEVSAVYGLDAYYFLAQAAMQGNVRDFEDCMQMHRVSFIRLGVFLVLERVKTICYRNLFKKVYRVVDSSRLSLTHFQAAINWMQDEEVSLDEVECILANLIFQKKLNGYINHEHRMLVVSKKMPFPTANLITPYVEANDDDDDDDDED